MAGDKAMRIFCILAAFLIWAVPAHAERRVALVIGNSAYEHVPQLANPKNDAADMAKKLQDLGFEVVFGEDLTLADMRTVARKFIKEIENADLSLFFYAGHGLQVNGSNYMAPVDAQLASYSDLDFEALPMDLVLSAMERSTKVNIVFLDACRDNPLAENLARSMGTRSGSVGRGLAKLGSGVGSLIAFATQPGNVALDGEGRNSPFTTALLKHLGTPGQSVTDDLVMVRKDVLDATGGKQVPWDNSSLTGPVVLKEKPKEEPKVEPAPAPEAKAPETKDNAVELAYWDSIKDGEDKGFFEAYLARWPEGSFADIAKLKIAALEKKAKVSDPVSPAQHDNAAELAYWNSIKDSGGTAYLEAYLARYPQGQFADLARIRIDEIRAAQVKAEADAKARQEAEAKAKEEAEKQKSIETAKLEQPAAAETATELAPVDPAELALATQKELARIGCLSGRADGKWGSGSERALKDYAGRQGIELASLQPSPEILDRLKATTTRVCPLVCGKGLEAKNGRCEKVKREAKVEPKPETRSATTAPAAPKATEPKANNQKTELGEVKVNNRGSERECMICPGNGGAGKVKVCKSRSQSWLDVGMPNVQSCKSI
jgi:uncharacterized caspase-like protein